MDIRSTVDIAAEVAAAAYDTQKKETWSKSKGCGVGSFQPLHRTTCVNFGNLNSEPVYDK
jgi:hypothetical protein